MLRRKPTALAITAEDIAAFEEAHALRVAYLKYRKTGEDPSGVFSSGQFQNQQYFAGAGQQQNSRPGTGHSRGHSMDPSDELKPLPGDKARIVRGREDRIIGNVQRTQESAGGSMTGPGVLRR